MWMGMMHAMMEAMMQDGWVPGGDTTKSVSLEMEQR